MSGDTLFRQLIFRRPLFRQLIFRRHLFRQLIFHQLLLRPLHLVVHSIRLAHLIPGTTQKIIALITSDTFNISDVLQPSLLSPTHPSYRHQSTTAVPPLAAVHFIFLLSWTIVVTHHSPWCTAAYHRSFYIFTPLHPAFQKQFTI